jgi:hypothetical protein
MSKDENDGDITDYTPKKGEPGYQAARWRRVFLDELAKTCNVALASDKAGVTRQTAYRHRRLFPRFAEKWDDAIDKGVDALYAEARRRGLEGVKKGIWHQGKRVGSERQYSDLLLIFLLKAHRPEQFRDNFDLGKALDGFSKRTTAQKSS